jgi:hypothetical protein
MKCFVIMPFGNPKVNPEHARRLDLIYSQWIKPTVESVKDPSKPDERIVCHRADKAMRPEEIITHVIEHLMTSDIVIADLSGKNANVFYELGVRHVINNNTILIAEDLDDIPFDLRGLRAIAYKYEPEGMLNLKRSLEQSIQEIFKDPNRIDNPVRRFIYNSEIDGLLKQPTPPGYDVLKDLIAELASLKGEFSEQVREAQRLMRLITSPEHNKLLPNANREIDLNFFEGIWRDPNTGSAFYPRVIAGKLLIPYSYYGDSKLRGHFDNCRLIGDTLFARFRWFDSEISGYLHGQIETEDKIVGGWWYSEDLPPSVLKDNLNFNESLLGTNRMVLIRDAEVQNVPAWVDGYFDGRFESSRSYLSVFTSLRSMVGQIFSIKPHIQPDAWLEGQPGSKIAGHIYHLSKFREPYRAILGSDLKGDVFIWIPDAQPRHAEITLLSNRKARLRHITAAGETRVNGIPIKEHVLRDRDLIDIGHTRLLYKERREVAR